MYNRIESSPKEPKSDMQISHVSISDKMRTPLNMFISRINIIAL